MRKKYSMKFNDHSALSGQHAFLSASKYHWVNYTDAKIDEAFGKYLATERGTILHEFASQAIRLGIKLANTKTALNRYVNDAIGFRMQPEQVLYYSVNAFGTADAISFRKDLLRIHDLKTGVSPVYMKQLEIYASYFCLEYDISPKDIDMELRIYQFEETTIHRPEAIAILDIMEKIVYFDTRLEKLKQEQEA
jgi:hypothetical protein